MMLRKIRDMNEKELAEVREIISSQEDFSFDWEVSSSFQHVRVAEDESRIVGICGWTGALSAAQPFVWVRPELRRQRYGTGMVKQLAAEMLHRGVRGLASMPIVATGGEAEAAGRLGRRFRGLIEGPSSTP